MPTLPDILEWQVILNHLESCCHTGYGRLLVNERDVTLGEADAIDREMRRVQEAKTLIQRYGDVTLQEPPDIVPVLQRLEKKGEIHSTKELGELLFALRELRQLARYFIQHRSKEETPVLLDEIESITLPNPIIERLEQLVSDSGELVEAASPEYARLKTRIRELRATIQQFFQRLINRPAVLKCLQEPVVTERDGRTVLPVKAEHKVDVPGIVHGASATGATLYIEPKGVVEMNNRLVSMQGDQEREIRKILKAVSEALHPEAGFLLAFLSMAAHLDLLLAKARQSLIFKANPIQINRQKGVISLRQARHPLLVLQASTVVPNDILLHPPYQVLLITGPNTGGKTVLLKLVGLFALMSQAGLHLPVAEGSSMSLFSPVLADIGDPQSIAQNLSTFSGHIARLKSFLEMPDLSQSLVLIDEICAGTDPEEGAGLAKALLEAFYQKGATVLVTTHIGELKVNAHQHEGYLNASVEFDSHSLSPTYRLILGVPGTSNALNIAARLGIPQPIVEAARNHLSESTMDSADLIESLERKNCQVARELEEIERLRSDAQRAEEQVRQQLERLETEKRKTLQMFREGLRDKLRRLEQEIDEIRQSARSARDNDSHRVEYLSKQLRHLQSESGELFAEETSRLQPACVLSWDTLQIGDVVTSRSLNLSAVIIGKDSTRRELTLQAGILKVTVPLADIGQKAGDQQKKSQKKQERSSGSVRLQPKTISSLRECDLRGMTTEDAIGVMEKFLDDALVAGLSTVSIIHGLGTGALKRGIRDHLKELAYIRHFGPAPANEGGDGKTLIDLE